jgi:hypothetical protein
MADERQATRLIRALPRPHARVTASDRLRAWPSPSPGVGVGGRTRARAHGVPARRSSSAWSLMRWTIGRRAATKLELTPAPARRQALAEQATGPESCGPIVAQTFPSLARRNPRSDAELAPADRPQTRFAKPDRSRRRQTVPDRPDQLDFARNDGVPGSSPGVGFTKTPAKQACQKFDYFRLGSGATQGAT